MHICIHKYAYSIIHACAFTYVCMHACTHESTSHFSPSMTARMFSCKHIHTHVQRTYLNQGEHSDGVVHSLPREPKIEVDARATIVHLIKFGSHMSVVSSE